MTASSPAKFCSCMVALNGPEVHRRCHQMSIVTEFQNECECGSATFYARTEMEYASERWARSQQDITADAGPDANGGTVYINFDNQM